MPTFVHTADVHFDTPFSARFTPKQAELRRKEVMQTFSRICEKAGECDLLLMAGDLFDSRFISGETIAFLKRCFANIPDTRIFLVAGNHDPMTPDSPYLKEDWGENVHIFGTEMEYVDIPELETRIHGRSFSQRHEEQSLLGEIPLREGWCNLLLLHGELVSPNGESSYNPLEKGKMEASGVDYAALGHIHLYSGILRSGNLYYAYPGIPEGRGFDETGERGYLTGTIERGGLQAEWIPVSKRKFICQELNVSSCKDTLEVAEQVLALIENQGEEHMYRLTLTGEADSSLVQIDVLYEQMKGKAFSLELRDETRPSYHLDELAKENTLRGDFVSAMLKEIESLTDEEKEIGYLALSMGLDAMERGKL